MDKLTPIRLMPAFKDYLWGGTRLKESYNKKSDLDIVAESWELSCHKDGQSVISGGKFDGKTLSEYIEQNGKSVLGSNAAKFTYFPILIKFIDAKQKLSVQVHPDDEYALREEGEYGKTEMWYVLEADEDAYLYYGFNRSITREELKERIENNTILEVLNKVKTKKGDVFFIESGTVHAIGEGNVICEIQQNSNLTYRVYDYDRRGKDGKPRELHVEKAVKVAHLEKAERRETQRKDGILAECKYFTVKKINVNGAAEESIDDTSFRSIVAVDGCGGMEINGEYFELNKGDSLFIPAQNTQIKFDGEIEIIMSYV